MVVLIIAPPLMVYVNMAKGYTQETFEKRVKEVHGDSIDVSNFKYINSITTVEFKNFQHEW
jgi:hypothetical protein